MFVCLFVCLSVCLVPIGDGVVFTYFQESTRVPGYKGVIGIASAALDAQMICVEKFHTDDVTT